MEQIINEFIQYLKKEKSDFHAGNISDGYHSFDELYEHRIALFIALCRAYRQHAWKSLAHSNGEIWEGWFIMGLFTEKGQQISYHLGIQYWEMLADIATIDRQPDWDGHTPQDIVARTLALGKELI
ncbi:MAG: hypothetical protein ACKVTZ_16465 [Bacteroidia bacterium]